MTPLRRRFIINATAGGGITPAQVAELERFFTAADGAFERVLPVSRNETLACARQALADGVEQVVAVGGDGTVNAVAEAFVDAPELLAGNARLAVANLGTGSDYFRTIARPSRRIDWKDLVLNHQVRRVDVGRAEFPAGGARYFVNMASAGLTGAVAVSRNARPAWMPRSLAYLAPAIPQILRCEPVPARVVLDDNPLELDLLAVIIAKGAYAGGGMRLGGRVSLDDGWFDVTLIGRIDRIQMFFRLPELYVGGLRVRAGIRRFRARGVAVHARRAFPFECDGEPGHTTELRATLLPRRLPVCVMPGYDG